jgi:UDP-glucose 4-epimerase
MNLAKQVISQTNSNSEIKLVPYEEAYDSTFEDMQRRIPDITKIGKLLNWQPKRDLAAIINSIAAKP